MILVNINMNLTTAARHTTKRLFKSPALYFQCKKCNYSIQSSTDVRKKFIDFFVKDNDHKFVASSPVVPFCDPTVAFVNAGMNQFKGVFLGQFSPPHPRVANSQKCVRVGGKHNDLDVVGCDGFHHTFFEMLGNWSFGDYYKKEACEMAWKLLTGPYGISPDKLAITYFGGDKALGLEADSECRDIWRSIGVPDSSLIPGNSKDNFWEMGAMGPCGPCTEIHYRGDNNQLMEIWNIVFIQFNRQNDGRIIPLPKCHIDTGMGLERMAALLQNKSSNYDTDLFTPLLQLIHEKSVGVPPYSGKFGQDAALDTAYRILADHARMISISLADGVFPCRNLRLRTVLRKALSISSETFKRPSGMLLDLYDGVAKSLGDAYPELHKKRDDAYQIIIQEEQSLATLEKSFAKQRKEMLEKYPETVHLSDELSPGLAEGYKLLKQSMKNNKGHTIPGSLAFKLYDTYGLDEEMILKIAYINNISVDMDSFKEYLSDHKNKHKAVFTENINSKINLGFNSKINLLINNGVKLTDDSFKYDYNITDDGVYSFPKLTSNLVAILSGSGDSTDSIKITHGVEYHLVFDKTNFYCEEGGQMRDIGKITPQDGSIFNVKSVSKIRGVVLHTGCFLKDKNNPSYGKLNIGDTVEMMIDGENRFCTMQHHTATHLLNAAIKKVLPGSVTCQMGSKVMANGLSLDLAIYGNKLSAKIINDAQEIVRLACSKSSPVRTSVIDGQQLLTISDVTTVPGEIYPESGLRLVEIDLLGAQKSFSKELCCGTHVPSAHLIGDFCVTGVRGAGGLAPTIRALAGKHATQVNNLAKAAVNLLNEFECNDVSDHKVVMDKIKVIQNELHELCMGEGAPYGVRADCLDTLQCIEKKMKEKDAKVHLELVKTEMATVVTEAEALNKRYLVHFLICSYLLEPSNLSLTTATQCGAGKPVLVMGCANGIVKATCQVPMNYVNKNFTAEKWMESVTPAFGTYVIPATKNQDPLLIAHMKGKKVSLINCESLVADAIKRATTFADKYLDENIDNDDKRWIENELKKKN